MKLLRLFCLLLLILIASMPTYAQRPGHTVLSKNNSESDPVLSKTAIMQDTAIKTGILSNGLRYYIRRNTEPKNRAELRLVVHAGSIQEDNDQLGVAHFVEHMCFKGTRHFKKDALISFIERSGLKFGADLNASTSFDQTVYQLSVPTDSSRLDNNKQTIFSRSFMVLEDWAHQVSFEADDIDNERNVITEEWRLGRGASSRMRDAYFPVILKGSRYASRIPIGTRESINKASHEAIIRFYKDWYRPDLMAIIAVGDFNVKKVEALIRSHFSNLKNPAIERSHINYTIPDNKEPLISIVTDKEQPYQIAELFYKHPKASDKTLEDMRSAICVELFNAMLNARILEHLQQADPPFLYGAASYGKFIGNLDAFQCTGVAKSSATITSTIESLMNDNERARKYGFGQSELDRAKKTLLASLEKQYQEQTKTNSTAFTDEYIDNFIYQGSLPSVRFSYEFARKYSSRITLSELNKLAARFTGPDNRMVVVMAPDKDKDKLPDAASIIALLDKSSTKLSPYADDATDKPLMPVLPKAGKITSQVFLSGVGITDIRMDNGLRVLVKPTPFKNNQILISAFSPGGTSVISAGNYQSSAVAADIIELSGVGDFSAIQLYKSLAGKTVAISPFIDEYQQGIRGSSGKEDFETALQLLHLYFTRPRSDTNAFHSFIIRETAAIANRNLDPGSVFADSVNSIMSDHNKRKGTPSSADIATIKLDSAIKIYRDQFADASGFTVVLVGNIDLKKINPLLEKYLGSLPATHKAMTWKDDLNDYPSGVLDKTISMGSEPKSQVRIFFTGIRKYDPLINNQLDLFLGAIEIKLRESLREVLGGTYGVSIYGSVSKIPREQYRIGISFGCAPENVQKLSKAALDILAGIKLKGIDAATLQKVKAESRRSYALDLHENTYWLQEISERSFQHENLYDITLDGKKVQVMTTEDTHRLANEFFNDQRKITIDLIPKG